MRITRSLRSLGCHSAARPVARVLFVILGEAMLTDREKKQFRRLVLTSIDLEQASSWGHYILENNLWDESVSSNKDLARGVQTAMIVAYIRPFSGNNKTEDTLHRPMLPLKSVLTDEQWKLHKCIHNRRNTVFAHSDSDVRDLEISVSNINGQKFVLPISNNPYVMRNEGELRDFLDLVETVSGAVSDRIIELQEKLSSNDKF